MALSRGASPGSLTALQHTALAALALFLLLSGVSGRAGVQVVDRATAARLFAVHLHGVPGERTYVDTYAQQAPFVPPHCHAPLDRSAPQPGPDEVQAAVSLAGAALCGLIQAAPLLPPVQVRSTRSTAATPEGRVLTPAPEPPR